MLYAPDRDGVDAPSIAGNAPLHQLNGAARRVRGGVNGRLSLRFTPDAARGHTILASREHRPPLQVIRTFTQADGAALVHLQNVSGGVLGGDNLETTLHIEADARAQVTTTSATRVYRPRAGDPSARQAIAVSVGENSLLEYLPDPLIPFAGADYAQETRISLAPGAGLFWWETVTPGRVVCGESFAYKRLMLNVDIISSSVPIARERALIEPERWPVSSLASLGPYQYMSTFYICRAGEPLGTWQALESELREMADGMSRPGEVLWGVSALVKDGLVIRCLNTHGRDIAAGLITYWRAAKQRLYGREAILPRKVY